MGILVEVADEAYVFGYRVLWEAPQDVAALVDLMVEEKSLEDYLASLATAAPPPAPRSPLP